MRTLRAVALLATLAGIAGCGPAIVASERPRFGNGVNTITFLVFDAFTGAPIEDAVINVSVGTHVIAATKSTGNSYVAAQLPFGQHLATITAGGHHTFLGQAFANSNGNLSSPTQLNYITYQVGLYPTGQVASDITVKVFESENGAAVTNGTVVATLIDEGGIGTPGFDNPLPGTLNTRPSTVTATVAGGVATLAKTNLILGATYSIDIFGATNAGGANLTNVNNTTFVAGTTFSQLNVFVGPPSPSPTALSVNNEGPVNLLLANLAITFPYAVDVCSTSTQHGWFVSVGGADGNSDGVFAAPPLAPAPAVTLTATDTVITLTPRFIAGFNPLANPGDGLLEVQFTGVRVKIRNTGNSGCTDISNIRIRNNGPFIDTSIKMVEAL